VEFAEHLIGQQRSEPNSELQQQSKRRGVVYENWKKIERFICVDCEVLRQHQQRDRETQEENVKLSQQVESF